MVSEQMDSRLTIVMTEESKEAFYKKCEQKSINPSHLIRSWINDFITHEV